MSKYIILQCEHNLKDCVNFWKIQLTEYGLCVVYGGMDENPKPKGTILTWLFFNRYMTVWRFKGDVNFRARIYFEKWEADSKEARTEMFPKVTHSPVANFFLALYRLKNL